MTLAKAISQTSLLLEGCFIMSLRKLYRFATSALFLILGLIFASWASRIPDVQRALALNDAQLGIVLLASPIGILPGVILAGFLVGTVGCRWTLSLAAPLCALILFSLGYASSTTVLFVGLLCMGIFSNLFDNALNTQAVAVEKIYNRSIMSTFHGMWSMGGVIGSIFGGFMATMGADPSFHFAIVACISLITFFLLRRYTLPRELHQMTDPSAKISTGSTSGRKKLILLGIIAFCSMATEGAMYNWSSIYFQSVLQTPISIVRLGYVACMIAMVTGRFTADRLITAWGETRVLQMGGGLIAGGFTLTFIADGVALTTLSFALVGFGMASGVPICYSLAGRLPRIAPSIAIATVVAISFWGFLITPPLIGFLSNFFNLRIALTSMGIMGLLIFCFAPALHMRKQKTPAL
jgi:MFS family permease